MRTWLAIIVPMAIVVALCAHWAPISHDGWGGYWWHRTSEITFASIREVAWSAYVHNNPRLGQLVTLLLLTPGPWFAIVAPIVGLGLFYLLATVVLGRWPSPRTRDDAWLYLLLVAMTMVVSPVIGPMLFYPPYVGNYLIGLVISLAFAVPYRFALERPTRGAVWHVPAMLVAGAVAGMCNEHTGPALAAFTIIAIIAVARRGRPPIWMLAGVVGVIGGGLALFYAPGQDIRYHALATHDSLIGRVVARGILGDLRVVAVPYLYLLAVVPWLALAGRAPPRSIKWLALASLAVAVTLLGSPKQGERLDFAAHVLAIAAAAGWVTAQLRPGWPTRLAVGLAVAVVVLGGWRCVHAYRTIAPEFAARRDALEHTTQGATLAFAPYTFSPPRSDARGYHRSVGTVLRWFVDARWFIGDELLVPRWRAQLARQFAVTIELTGPDAFDEEVGE